MTDTETALRDEITVLEQEIVVLQETQCLGHYVDGNGNRRCSLVDELLAKTAGLEARINWMAEKRYQSTIEELRAKVLALEAKLARQPTVQPVEPAASLEKTGKSAI